MNSIFKYSELASFLRHTGERFMVTSLGKWDGSNAIILRHDVDFQVERAYDLALLEKDCNVTSTFFFLTTCHSYNPMSALNRSMIRRITEMGFEVGLHFDPSVYGGVSDSEMEQHAWNEARILSTTTGQDVKSISIHNPSVHGKYLLFEGFRNAYDPAIFSSDRYLSDSRMEFLSDIWDFVERVKDHPVQVLLHPLHFSQLGEGYPSIFSTFVHNWIEQVDQTARCISTYRAQMKTDLLTHAAQEHLRLNKS